MGGKGAGGVKFRAAGVSNGLSSGRPHQGLPLAHSSSTSNNKAGSIASGANALQFTISNASSTSVLRSLGSSISRCAAKHQMWPIHSGLRDTFAWMRGLPMIRKRLIQQQEQLAEAQALDLQVSVQQARQAAGMSATEERSPFAQWLQQFFLKVLFAGENLEAAELDTMPQFSEYGRVPDELLTSDSKSTAAPVKQQQQLSPEDQPLYDLFKSIDINDDGFIDAMELRRALAQLGLPYSPMYLKGMMNQYDFNHDNLIDWEEFKEYIKRRDEEIDAAFREFDEDGNGEISTMELGRLLQRAGLPTTGRDIRRMMEILDSDGTNTISYKEFRRFACLLPSAQVLSGNPMMYAGWWRAISSGEGGSGAMRRSVNDPFKHFLAFDLFLRTSLAASLIGVLVFVLNP